VNTPVTSDLAQLATGFGRSLRRSGLDAPPSATIDFAQALALLGTTTPEHVFFAGQACFCRRAEDFKPYATTFWAYFAVTNRFPSRASHDGAARAHGETTRCQFSRRPGS